MDKSPHQVFKAGKLARGWGWGPVQFGLSHVTVQVWAFPRDCEELAESQKQNEREAVSSWVKGQFPSWEPWCKAWTLGDCVCQSRLISCDKRATLTGTRWRGRGLAFARARGALEDSIPSSVLRLILLWMQTTLKVAFKIINSDSLEVLL